VPPPKFARQIEAGRLRALKGKASDDGR